MDYICLIIHEISCAQIRYHPKLTMMVGHTEGQLPKQLERLYLAQYNSEEKKFDKPYNLEDVALSADEYLGKV